jgi:hypothetical protein
VIQVIQVILIQMTRMTEGSCIFEIQVMYDLLNKKSTNYNGSHFSTVGLCTCMRQLQVGDPPHTYRMIQRHPYMTKICIKTIHTSHFVQTEQHDAVNNALTFAIMWWCWPGH